MDLDNVLSPAPEEPRAEYQKPELVPLGSLAKMTGSSAGPDSDGMGPAPEIS